MTVNVSTTKTPVTVKDDKVTITVSGGIGPQGPAGAGGVTSLQGLSGALTLAAVGGSWSAAGSTITLTVTGGGAGAVSSVAGRTGDVVLVVADVSGAVATSDSRLSDSREWSAATVTQADAEAGVATVRVAWTVQRVWQAIAAWWAASASKAKLDGIASGATANQTDAYLLARANHTGTQSYTTVTGLGTLATQSSVSYASLTGTPSTFAPSSHAASHAAAGSDPITVGTVAGKVLVTTTGGALAAVDYLDANTQVGNLAASALIDTTSASNISSGTLSVLRFPTTGINATWITAGTLSAARLAASGVTAATYGSASSVPVVVVDAAGRITSASSTAIAISSGAVSGLAAVATSGSAADLTGTLAAARLPNTTVTAGSYGSASSVATFTVDAAGRLTASGSTSIAIAAGAVSGLAAVATSGSASDLGTGTLPVARIPTGSTSTTVCIGNDSRLSDARTPTAHSHGNLTNAGAIGSQTDMIVVTGASGVLTTATIGSGLSLSGGTLTASGGGSSYTLPAATTTTLGGVIVGAGLAVDGSGNLTVNERLYTTLSSTTTSATTTETTIASASVTGAANDVFRIRWWGTLTNNSGGSCTYTYRLKLGSTTLATITRSRSSATTVINQFGEAVLAVISTTSQTATLSIGQGASTEGALSGGNNSGVSTETISSALTLSVTCQMSASTGTPSAPQFITTAAWIERTKG